MEMGAFTGALVALLAKDMASAIASEMGKDVTPGTHRRLLVPYQETFALLQPYLRS